VIYVDDLIIPVKSLRPYRAGVCRMTADDIDELHDAAARLGLARRWYRSERRMPHYPLTVEERARAVEAGAVYRHSDEALRSPVNMTPVADDGRVLAAMRDGAARADALADATGLSRFAVGRALSVLVRRGKAVIEGGEWVTR
jgi:predicted Rossmann fold nucleotide-binding protein DprA/Smf involved in DNA uptake